MEPDRETSIATLLAAHRRWLETGGQEGQRIQRLGSTFAGSDCRGATLCRADLSGADLKGSDFTGADLSSAILDGADLTGANLEQAKLAGASLIRGKLQDCRLRNVEGLATAEFRDADLRGASGLAGTEFAGADLTGVRLPEGLSFDGRLAYVATSSQNARPAFLSILLSCVFVILTVFSTPDAALLANASLALLPNLSTDIPAASFFWVSPLLLLGLYVYLHLQMTGIGETLAQLPRVFPDGTPLSQRAYPWVATNLLRLKGGWRQLQIEELVAIALLWGAVPLTLLAIWFRYLPLRHWAVSFTHVALCVAGAWGAIRLFEQTAQAMCGDALRIPHRRAALTGFAVVLSLATLAVGLLPMLLDINPRRYPFFVIDIRDADLSHAQLQGKDLRYASGRGSNLSGADLRDVRFSRADFQRASFVGADLEDATLNHTDLDSADFRNACLRKTSLDQADIEDGDFRGAYLGGASLRTPLLTRARFAGANLQGADLRGAGLAGADFTDAVLRCAFFGKKSPEPVIECANLEGADLSGARFDGADLRYATGLTQQQLDAACGSAATRLPDGLTLSACPARSVDPLAQPEADSPPAQANPCAHERLDDRWPQ